ncbi:hypothetical protein D3C72_1737280 [compost metagenome]
MISQLAAGRTRHEADGPHAGMRPLHHDGGTKCIAAFGKQGVGHLFDAGIDRAHHRYTADQGITPAHQLAADEIAGRASHQQQDRQREHHAKTRHMVAQDLVWLPALRQDLQGLVKRTDDPAEHPDRDHTGHNDQQSGQQPFAQCSHGWWESLCSRAG